MTGEQFSVWFWEETLEKKPQKSSQHLLAVDAETVVQLMHSSFTQKQWFNASCSSRLFFLLVLRSSWSCQPCRRVCCRILWGKWGSRSGRHKLHLWFPDTSDTRWWSLGVKSQTQPQWTKQDISFSVKKFNYLSCGWCSPCLPRIIWVLGPMTFLHCWTTKSNWWVNPSWVLRQNAIRLLTAWRLEKTLFNFKKLFPGVSLSTVSWHQCTQIWPILL